MSDPLIPALVAMGGLATAGSVAAGRLRRSTPSTGWRWWHTAAVAAGALNLVLIVLRAYDTTPPRWLGQNFDVTILLATLVLAVGLACALLKHFRGLDAFFLPIAALIQAVAFLALLPGPARPVTDAPAWFVVHMLTLVLGTTCFVAGGTAALVYLALDRALRHKRRSKLAGHVPPLERLDWFARWMLTLGLPLFTFGILTGICEMVRADEPWAWMRDPVVLMSFGLWLAYAGILIAIWLQPRHRGRRVAWLATSAVAVVLVVFFVLNLFPTKQH